MKKYNSTTLIFTVLLLTTAFFRRRAQNETPPNDQATENLNRNRRPNLLAELNLSPDQIQRIRRINREQQPLIRQAQQRVKEANRDLDAAIYADAADEAEIQSRLKEEQTARHELSKLKATAEYQVRKTLNPEQLAKFREVRQAFKDRMENLPKQRKNRTFRAPGQRLLERQRKMRQND